MNARGLEGVPVAMTAQFGPALPEQDVGFAFAETWDAVGGSEVVANESGGFIVRNTNDLNAGIQRIANETRVYYLLGYIPTNTARDGKFRKIEVKLDGQQGARGARAQGLLRAHRVRPERVHGQEGQSTPRSRARSTRPGRSTASRCA